MEKTVSQNATCQGIGLHSGQTTHVTIAPAPPGVGLYFVRTDLPGQPTIPVTVSVVQQTMLSTELVTPYAQVRTVEHLLASLWALGITNARIEIDGGEVPLLDGSAIEWVNLITEAGIHDQTESNGSVPPMMLQDPLWVRSGDSFVAAIPSPELRFSYGIDFDLAAIGNQWHSWAPHVESFRTAIAPARTFGLAHQIDQLRSAGLIKGGSLENALVCAPDGWINPPLRFPNEPVRHKLLDLIGDLSLVRPLPIAHYMAYKASHRLHTQLARQLLHAP